jgi:hypothetical protein
MTYSGTPEEQRAKAAAAQKKWRTDNKEKYNAYIREHMQKYRKDRPEYREYYRLYAKRWRIENPEKHKASRRKYDTPERTRATNLQRNYGITVAEYDAMVVAQADGCAICGAKPTGAGKNQRRLHVDHDHETKQVRGLLCHSCNIAIASFERVVNFAERVNLYLARYKKE